MGEAEAGEGSLKLPHEGTFARARSGVSSVNDKKREVFEMLAATYQKLAADLEAVIATNAILDEERDKRLLGLLGKDDNPAESITEIAKLLGQTPDEPKPPES